MEATATALDHFAPELTAIAALSQRYNLDLRSVHQAGIASQILCSAYRDRYGCKPVQALPGEVRYTPPAQSGGPRTRSRPHGSIG